MQLDRKWGEKWIEKIAKKFTEAFQPNFLKLESNEYYSFRYHFVEPPFEKSGKISGEKNLLKLDPNE